jgi:uncharacterized protein (DUF58 family)
MKQKPTIKMVSRLPIFLLLLLLALAIFLPDRVWNILLVGFGGLVGIAYGWVRLLANGVRGSRSLRFGWVAVGDRLSEQFELRNGSGLPALWVEIADESNVPGYEIAVVRSLGHNQVNQWRQSTICLQRGQFHLGPWQLLCGDPFGLFQVTIPYPGTEEIIIHPPIHSQIPVPLPAGQGSGRVRARERAWQATINAGGVREYRPADPMHWIHWPTTAHRGALSVRQFDLDAAGPVWVILDLQASVQLDQGAEGTEEQAILVAAALVAQGLANNRSVGLATYAREPQLIPPARGKNQQWKVLRALALAKADGEIKLAAALHDLSQVARRGSAAVIITPSGEASWMPDLLDLAGRGISCSVILLDRVSFSDVSEGEGSSEGLRKNLQRYGVSSHIIRQGEFGRPEEQADRRGFWEFKVTGTGKVITLKDPFNR